MADKALCGAKGNVGVLGKVAWHRPAGHSGPRHAKGLRWGRSRTVDEHHWRCDTERLLSVKRPPF
jgi:hypothetical protein